jgi:hypothetical protein
VAVNLVGYGLVIRQRRQHRRAIDSVRLRV